LEIDNVLVQANFDRLAASPRLVRLAVVNWLIANFAGETPSA
jgi:hypothetical protein